MDTPLKREFEFYLANKAKLLAENEGKYVVIKDQAVIASYDDELTAVTETEKEHELGTFLVQLVQRGDEADTQMFFSRVVFPHQA